MVDRIEGKLKRTNKKRKQTSRFTIEGDMPREEWAELYEKIKVALKDYGVRISPSPSPSTRKKTTRKRR